MILKLPENRSIIIEYLEKVDEDSFIDNFIIPFFTSQGYQVYRINSHGPGEHGKDIIFCRYVPIFFSNEYICVQAKTEKVIASNVTKNSDQLKRALGTKFTSRSGDENIIPHYAIFINARKHSNDAYTEFPQLVNSPHAKILSQESVCEIIMQTGIAPKHVLDQLSIESKSDQNDQDRVVYDTLLRDTPAEADHLLDHKLKFIKDDLSQSSKNLVIEYIQDRWQKDRSWSGTVKPMKWFDLYFDFFTIKYSNYLLIIAEELISSTASHEALRYTESVVSKFNPELLSPIQSEYINLCAKRATSYPRERINLLISKLREFHKAKLISKLSDKVLTEKVLAYEDTKFKDSDTKKRQELVAEIHEIVFQD